MQHRPGSVVVQYTAVFEKNNISHHEKHPKLFTYLSAHVTRKEADHCEIPLYSDKEIAGQVSGYAKGDVSANATLCAALFAWRPDAHSGVLCKVCLGTSRVSLQDIVAARPNKDRPFEALLDMRMHAMENFQKGVVRLKVTNVSMPGLSFANDQISRQISPSTAVNPVEQQLDVYFKTIARMKQQMGESLQGTERMDAPYDFSECGFTMCRLPMPFLSFALRELPETNAAMWENSLLISLKRDGLQLHDFFQLNNRGKARTLATMITLVPSYYDYTSDVLLKDSIADSYSSTKRVDVAGETFGEGEFRSTGEDCEDSGNQNAEMLESFQIAKLPTTNLPINRALRELQQISKNYIAMRSLDVVRGAQVSDRTGYGAHLNANLVTFAHLKNGMDPRIASKIPWPQDMEHDTSKWPMLVAEGTGIYEPLGYKEDMHPKAYVYSAPSLASLKKPIGHDELEATPFFVASLIGTTGHFIRQGSRYGTFFYTNGSAGNRGALYADIIADNKDKFGFVPFPPITKPMLNIMRESNAVAVPPIALTLDRSKFEHGDEAERHPLLERIVASVEQLGRRKAPGTAHVAAPIYIRPYQLSNKVVGGMIGDFKRMSRVYKITYHLERITDTIYGYRMMVHVNE